MFNKLEYSSSTESMHLAEASKLRNKPKAYLAENNGSFEYKRNSGLKKSKYAPPGKYHSEQILHKLVQHQQQPQMQLCKYTNRPKWEPIKILFLIQIND